MSLTIRLLPHVSTVELFEQARQDFIKKNAVEIKHWHNGQLLTDKAVPDSDAFYEIVEGPRAGNLVHIWNVQS